MVPRKALSRKPKAGPKPKPSAAKPTPSPAPDAPEGYVTGAAAYSTKGDVAEPARLHGKPFHCLACRGSLFYTRHSLLNTFGLTLLEWDAFNKEATNLICRDCGYIHWFTIPQ